LILVTPLTHKCILTNGLIVVDTSLYRHGSIGLLSLVPIIIIMIRVQYEKIAIQAIIYLGMKVKM